MSELSETEELARGQIYEAEKAKFNLVTDQVMALFTRLEVQPFGDDRDDLRAKIYAAVAVHIS